MATGLLTIPPEILRKIFLNLHGSDIENVSKTFNKYLTAVCQPLIEYRVAARRNTKRMISFFGKPRGDAYALIDLPETYEKAGLEREWGPYSGPIEPQEEIPEPCKDFLNLDGSLYWLKPWQDAMGTVDSSNQKPEMKRITAAADRLGLKLPEAFVSFMQDDRRWAWIERWTEFDLPDTMLKKVKILKPSYEPDHVPKDNRDIARGDWKDFLPYSDEHATADDVIDGYILRFMKCRESQSTSLYWSLYLDKGDDTSGPGHCVVSSWSDPAAYYIGTDPEYRMTPSERSECFAGRPSSEIDEEIKCGNREVTTRFRNTKVTVRINEVEEELGIWPLRSDGMAAFMLTTSFEELLAQHYFYSLGLDAKNLPADQMPEPFRQHLIDVYSTKGKKMS